MKRLLFIIAMLVGYAGIFAQQITLEPTNFVQSLSAHHPHNVLLSPNAHFSYMENGLFEYQISGLSFNYESMTLTLCETRDPTPKEAEIYSADEYPWHNKYEMKITKEQADALFSLFTAAVYSSNYIGSDGLQTSDGCLYRFTANRRSAKTVSPDSKTNCGRLVTVARKVCQSVKAQNASGIDALINEMAALTDIFISYYPLEFSKHSVMYEIHKRYKVKGPSVGLKY